MYERRKISIYIYLYIKGKGIWIVKTFPRYLIIHSIKSTDFSESVN